MIRRCRDRNRADWKNYGGRGITVCERWQSFENFLADMGEKPTGLTIERRDVNGHYFKANCHWATRKEQNRNTRRSRYLTHNGHKRTLGAWAEELKVSHTTILSRLKRGWSLACTLSTPGPFHVV